MSTLERLLDRFVDSSVARPLTARVNVLLPGLYAWATTVAVPVTASRAPGEARVTAMLSLVALVLGPLVMPVRPLLGRIVGIHGFIALSAATWALVTRAGLPLGGEPLHATFGALGWMLYAFGWGELRGPGRVPEDDPRVLPGAPLAPRSELQPSVGVVVAFGIAGALALVHLGFRVTRPAHAVMAQAIALVAGLFLVGGAVRVALDRGARPLPSQNERFARSAPSIAALVVVLGLGALFFLLGR